VTSPFHSKLNLFAKKKKNCNLSTVLTAIPTASHHITPHHTTTTTITIIINMHLNPSVAIKQNKLQKPQHKFQAPTTI
jgi:hypothetical protein